MKEKTTNKDKVIINENIKRIAKEKGITIKELSKKLGYNAPTTLYSYLNRTDIKYIDLDRIQAIADALDVDIRDILGEAQSHVTLRDILETEDGRGFIDSISIMINNYSHNKYHFEREGRGRYCLSENATGKRHIIDEYFVTLLAETLTKDMDKRIDNFIFKVEQLFSNT